MPLLASSPVLYVVVQVTPPDSELLSLTEIEPALPGLASDDPEPDARRGMAGHQGQSGENTVNTEL